VSWAEKLIRAHTTCFQPGHFARGKNVSWAWLGIPHPWYSEVRLLKNNQPCPKKQIMLFFFVCQPFEATWCEMILTDLKFCQNQSTFFKINSLIIIFERFLGRFRRRRTCKLGLARRLGDQNHWQPCHFQVKFHSSNQQETKNNCIQIQQSTPTNVNQHQSKSITYQHE
jgi:hypothetical protein